MYLEWHSPSGDNHDFTGNAVFFHRPVRLDDVVEGKHRASVYFCRACFDGVHESLQGRADEVLGKNTPRSGNAWRRLM